MLIENTYVGYVYMHTCILNNKSYIGITKRTVEDRWKQHVFYAKSNNLKSHYFHQAIQKYGEENFTHKTLEVITAETEKDLIKKLNEREIFYIKKYKTCWNDNNSNGYNITPGGNTISSTIKRPVSQYNLNGDFIRKYNSATEAEDATNVRATHIAQVANGIERLAGGFIWLDAEKEITNEIIEKANAIYTIPVTQYDLNGNKIKRFNSSSEAAKEIGVSSCKSINNAATGKTPTAYGFIWLRNDEEIKPEMIERAKKYTTKEVFQYDLNGNLIIKYNSLRDAARLTGFCRASIKNACDKENHQYREYLWTTYEKQFSKDEIEFAKKMYSFNNVKIANGDFSVTQFDTSGKTVEVFISMAEASRKTGISIASISCACNKKIKMAGGYIWKKNCEYQKVQQIVKKPKYVQKPVYQYDLNENYIGQHKSIWDASRNVGISASCICHVCNGTAKTAGGFFWSHDYQVKTNELIDKNSKDKIA